MFAYFDENEKKGMSKIQLNEEHLLGLAHLTRSSLQNGHISGHRSMKKCMTHYSYRNYLYLACFSIS